MLQKSGAPTLRDVAREAGVSLKTASRTLNSSPNIAPDTMARVREAMTRLGYRSNEMARSLRSRKSAAIGMVVPNLADPFVASSVKAIQDAARARGHAVILAGSGGDEAIEREEVDLLMRRQVDGLILVPANGSTNTLADIVPEKTPVVTFDQPMLGSDWDCITIPNRASAKSAAKHLVDRGCKRILAVGARPHLYTCAERVEGYRSAVKAAKLTACELLVEHESELTPERIAKALAEHEPDAVFTLNWVTTMLILRGFRALASHSPKHLPFISFDDFEMADILTPALTVVRQPVAEMGKRAAELLFDRMLDGHTGPRREVVLPTVFEIRASSEVDS